MQSNMNFKAKGTSSPKNNMPSIPTDYIEGAKKARKINAPLTETYLKYLHVGDSDADKAIADMSHLPTRSIARLIEDTIEDKHAVRVPKECYSLNELFEKMRVVPDWFDPKEALPGRKIYYRHLDSFFYGLVAGSIIEGFSTNIAKSFIYTGRIVEGQQALRRLRQNNRHFMEIYLPEGLQPGNEGWKYSLRIRLVHAQIRHMLSRQKRLGYGSVGSTLK